MDIQYSETSADDTRRRVREHLATMRLRSSEAGVSMAERVATAAEALVAVPPPSRDAEREVLDTAIRSLDLATLLVDDAGRRRQGYPPAALHEAVHVLLEQVERLKPQLETKPGLVFV